MDNQIEQFPPSACAPVPACWKLPEPDFVKINFDMGIDLDSNMSTLAMVAHDNTGNCCGWSMVSFPGTLSSYDGELSALRFGIKCALLKKWKKIVFEGDNISVINDTKDGLNGSGPTFTPLLNDICALCSGFESVLFSWVPRSLNVVAHNIVKRVVSPPSFLRVFTSYE